MLAKKYRSEVVSIVNPLEGIYTLEFCSLGHAYKYAPGQFLHIAIDDTYDGTSQWPESRCFSMQSHPGQETIRITYAVKGSFTRKMEKNLKVGSDVWLKLPYGELFTQEHNKEQTVFIAGGTGITPYLSLFTHESFRDYLNPRIYLGFRSGDYHIYQQELSQSQNPSRQVTLFFENTDGIIDIHRIFQENGTDASYFISGPPAMIKGFRQVLADYQVPVSHILTDDWE